VSTSISSALRAEKVSFDTGGSFLRETRRDVERYLQSRSTRLWGRLQLYAKSVVAFGLMFASWALLLFGRPGAIGAVLGLAGFVLGVILLAFCVQHDANHGAFFRTRRANHLLGWTSDVFLGFGSYAWRVKHNIAHHTYTNVEGYDDDINQAPFARLTPTQTPRPWHRWQHLYMWLLYTLLVLRWHAGGDVAPLRRGKIGESVLRFPRGWDLAGLITGKALFACWAVIVPLLVYPWWVVAAVYAGVTMITGLVMAVTFQLAHCVEEAAFASPAELRETRRVWAVHEVESTVNFCPGSAIVTWLVGGLNYQIEHHLFPRVSHTHYPRISAIVRRNAARHGIRYTAQPTLRAALRSHYRHLRTMGRLGIPVEIEMG
jgi:linoleoyl-CoA desaturase